MALKSLNNTFGPTNLSIEAVDYNLVMKMVHRPLFVAALFTAGQWFSNCGPRTLGDTEESFKFEFLSFRLVQQCLSPVNASLNSSPGLQLYQLGLDLDFEVGSSENLIGLIMIFLQVRFNFGSDLSMDLTRNGLAFVNKNSPDVVLFEG